MAHPSVGKSASIKLKYQNQEIDLNIYGESSYANFSQWQFNADRMRFDCLTPKFEINNNQAAINNHFNNCSEFLSALQNKTTNLWQHNPKAKGFLNRILKASLKRLMD